MEIKKPEILSPAKDLGCLKTAVRFGADAVYVGGEAYGMRSGSASFTKERLKEGAEFAHQQGAKVYVTLNILARNEEMEKLPDFLETLRDTGIDALIVTSIGTMKLVQKILPEMEIHISTQAGVVNYLDAEVFYEMGAKRVVLSRELSFSEISTIRQNTSPDLDLEAFVHGAICMGSSGRCLISNYLVNRDANHGDCAQPCRWNYHLMEERRPGQYFPVEEDKSGTTILSARDLSMLGRIPELVTAGITSFKIEGRAKSEYYTGVVTNAYRQALDAYWNDPSPNFKTPDFLMEEVEKVSHRPYSYAFYDGTPDDGQHYRTENGYLRPWGIMAVSEEWKDGRLYCTQRGKFQEGDTMEILMPGTPPLNFVVADLKDEKGNSISDTRHAMMSFSLKMEQSIPTGAILRKEIE